MFKHFLRQFNMMNERLKRADIPGKVPVLQLIRENMTLPKDETSTNLKPFCFYTDGGTYNDDTKYFLQNIFSRSGVCYSSRIPKNTNI